MRKSLRPLVLLAGFAWPAIAQESIGPDAKYVATAEALTRLIEHEREAKGLPAVSIALVADGKIVWSHGFGMADPAKKIPATAETTHRVGSVSKLFTDLALMQLVDEGLVDLDAPVKTYLPTFDVKNPTDKPITLRQLMSHRSGITREPPVGHYFDDTRPTQAQTVASLNSTEIVYPPTTRTKYSNAGIAVVGEVVATLRKTSFQEAAKSSVLERFGMARSDFQLTPDVSRTLAKAQMWTYDGRTFEAPTFPLGTVAAGNLYSTVNDLGKFLIALTNDGGGVVKPETFKAMTKVQFSEEANGFGLGFMVSSFEGCPRIGHSGAVYGFATDVQALPYAKLGVAVVSSKDCANGVSKRIAEDALRLMLAMELRNPLPELRMTKPVDPAYGKAVSDVWLTTTRTAEGVALQRGLALEYARALYGVTLGPSPYIATREEMRVLDGTLVYDGPFRVSLSDPFPMPPSDPNNRRDEATIKRMFPDGTGNSFVVPDKVPPGPFDHLIGEYGWDHNVLYVLEKNDTLTVLIEWFFEYPLMPTGDANRYQFHDDGLYMGEAATFRLDASGKATEVKIGDVVFKRRAIPGEDGKTFQIKPVRPVDELRAEALKATPPKEAGEFLPADLVDLTTLDPTIKLDIRYASDNNFLGTPFYTQPKALMQRPAAEALAKANRSLKKRGVGLLIHDAYRPWYVTKMFWDATPETDHNFVADPAKGSKHNRGCAVDLTLYSLKTGKPVRMVGGYDEFSDRSNPYYPGGTTLQRVCRGLLRRAMEDAGFSVNEFEWWHFDYKDWAKYPIGNTKFEDLGKM